MNDLFEWIVKNYPNEKGFITVLCTDQTLGMIEIAYENGKVEDMYEKFGFKGKHGIRNVVDFEATKFGRSMEFNFDVHIE